MPEKSLTKKCSKCKSIKSVDEFSINKKSKSGYKSKCKVCNARDSANWRKTNPDYAKQWRQDNSKYNTQWQRNNPNYSSEYSK